MITKWRLRLLQISQKMWFRSSLLALLGVLSALLAVTLEPFLPEHLPTQLGATAVEQILNILASSMLAVTTFSLSIMVASLSAATSNVTPRATKLLMQDSTTQNVLAVFLGTFLFSLVGIVALKTGYYTDRGRFVLFIVSIGVIGLVVFTMLRWIDHLTRLGRVSETTARVERATADAIKVRLKTPYLGGRPLGTQQVEAMRQGQPIFSAKTGYVAYVDMGSIQGAAERLGVEICLCATPGSFVYATRPLAVVLLGASNPQGAAQPDTEKEDALRRVQAAFDIEEERSFSQDPRFGISVLAEIASRALSPAVNDPGTAIDVLGRGVRLLAPWVKPFRERDADDIACQQVYVPELQDLDLFDDFFIPIARDGAANVEVQIRLQKALLALAELGDAESRSAALHHSREALERAESALQIEADKKRLREIVGLVEARAISKSE